MQQKCRRANASCPKCQPSIAERNSNSVAPANDRRPHPLCLKIVAHPHQIHQRFGFHLMHQVSAVNFYRKLANPKFRGDLFVQTTFDDLKHDLTLTRRQQRKTIFDFQ